MTNEGDINHRDNIVTNYKDSYVEPGKLYRLLHILGLHLPLQSAFLSSSFSSSSRSLSLDFLLGTQYLECLALPEDSVAGSFKATMMWLGEGTLLLVNEGLQVHLSCGQGQGGRGRLGPEEEGEQH